jgi:hypothetical protein
MMAKLGNAEEEGITLDEEGIDDNLKMLGKKQ